MLAARTSLALSLTFACALACAPQGGDDTATAGTTTDTDTTTTSSTSTTSSSGAATTADPESTTADPESTTADPDTTTGGGELLCPASIEAAILACVDALKADPELSDKVFLLDMLLSCADAEPVADDYDAHCAQDPDDPICALDYRTFIVEVLPQCTAGAQAALFADVCLLPEAYRDLLFTPSITLMERRFIADPAELSPVEADQLLFTSAELGFPVVDVADALLATDDGGFEQLTVLDVGTDRVLVVYSAHYGDTRVGRAFFQNTFTVVGAIEDGDFTRCGVERGVEGQPCEAPADDMVCGPGFTCEGMLPGEQPGQLLGPGVCRHTAPPPGQDAPCASDDACAPTDAGLLCQPFSSKQPDGLCRPGWMRHTFGAQLVELVPGATTTLPIIVSGLATVATRARLDLTLGQAAANGLIIRLINPIGTEALVLDTTGAPTLDIHLDLLDLPVTGDEPVNGVWRLEIDDAGGAAQGAVYQLALTLDSRWD
ncbi:MAG: hypothetical protein IPK80_26790 [Nannocystis sp.]|nr:hypothetical protein [Nannocystis sp.]